MKPVTLTLVVTAILIVLAVIVSGSEPRNAFRVLDVKEERIVLQPMLPVELEAVIEETQATPAKAHEVIVCRPSERVVRFNDKKVSTIGLDCDNGSRLRVTKVLFSPEAR